jgi:hypothetical protein
MHMGVLFTLLGGIFVIASIVCSIMVLIDAFRNEAWKGILGFVCGLYLLYYAFTEYQGNNKMIIILGMLLGGLVGGGLRGLGASMSGAR